MKRNTREEQEEVKEQEPITIMVVGPPGVGKSTLCSYLVDGRESQRFKSSKASVGGVTREMKVAIGQALGDSSMSKVKVIETAGFGDPTFSMKDQVKEFKKVFSSKDKIDILIFVTRSTDVRVTLQERTTLTSLKRFMTKIKPESFYFLISHSDIQLPNEDFIDGKLACITQYAGVDCPRDNVILFKKDAKSLKRFVKQIKTDTSSDMHVNLAQLDENADRIAAETSEMISRAAEQQAEKERQLREEAEAVRKEQDRLAQVQAAAAAEAARVAQQLAAAHSAAQNSRPSGFRIFGKRFRF